MAILVTDKADFRTKKATRDNDIIKNPLRAHSIYTHTCIYTRAHITILNVFVPNNKAAIYMNQILKELKTDTEKSTTTAGNLNILLSITEQLENQQGYRTQQYH